MIMVEFDRSQQHAPRPVGGHYAPQPLSHHGSPHLQHLDRPSPSARSTPSPTYQYASLPQMPPQAPSIRPTPTSYPSPVSYPSPSMPAYQFPPQQVQPPPPVVSRGSPYAQPATINLPPIRLNPPVVGQLQPAPPMHEASPVLGSPLHHPAQQYYHHPQHALPPPTMVHQHITSSPIHQPLRYPIPSVGNNERIMSGGRHKKEIKRRTKTGCLTCRKRRIKCDEGHPTCKNCQKSKRDCLGYDPIFKPQPGPAAIQPAPSGVGHGYSQTISTASSPASSCDTYDYPPVDPCLDATSHPHHSAPASVLDSPVTYRPELKRTFDRTSPFSSASETARTPYTPGPIPRSATPGSYMPQEGGNSAKRIKIDDLLSVGSMAGGVPPPLSPPSSDLASGSTTVESTKSIYKSRFAPAVDTFLETSWFTTNGLNKLWTDAALMETMAEVFERFKARGGSYVDEEDPSIRRSGMDSEILWAAVKMCYGTKIPTSDTRREDESSGDMGRDDERTEALRRINIVESLVTGCPLEQPPLSPKSRPAAASGEPFWRNLGRLASIRNEDAVPDREIRGLLDECHGLLGSSQSRHLLFSIAEWQHLRGETSKTLRDHLRHMIEDVAKSPAAPINCLNRRIAGRALGLWGIPITETHFCMPAA